MATDNERLDKIEHKLDRIAETLNVVAVQNEQIGSLQIQVNALWHKYDGLTGPDSLLARVSTHQASCPRGQIKYLWMLIVPLSLTILGVGFKILQ